MTFLLVRSEPFAFVLSDKSLGLPMALTAISIRPSITLFGEGIMPDIKLVIPVIIGVAVLVTIATSLDWLLVHPRTLIASVALIGGLIYLIARRSNARSRV
jgi:hypothetical protein